ncbi:ABC transporter ATP-binding protein [Paenibacillus daejeonensis]|uniref:ABC transporter ATP-binding protein n=1 Tax=Paenibacillus daejeonensis TaxID=135193 RepID=UPI00035EEF6F|nr:ABC transporter ATP-binding protein [Paenibacillus daejeonensis]
MTRSSEEHRSQTDQPAGGGTARRLFRYVLLFKRKVAIAIVILVVALAAQLAGPLLAKQIIDEHIQAITWDWAELPQTAVPEGIRSVAYRDMAYVRSDWAAPDDLPAGEGTATIRQDGLTMILKSPTYGETTLRASEVTSFYQHDTQPVLWLVGAIILLGVVASVLNFIQSLMLQTVAQRIVQRIRMDVFRNMHRIPIRYFDNTPVGQIVSRIANDTENIKELYMSFMATFVVSGLNILGVFTALLFLDWRMALVCAILLPIYTLIIILHLKFSRRYVAAIRARLAEMNATLNETIHTMPILQAFRREARTREEFEVLNEDRYRNQRMQFRIFAFSGRNAVYFVGRIFTAMIIWYFGSQSLTGAISFGVFYLFIDYLGRIFEPIIGIFDQMMNAQRAVVSAERVFELMDKEGQEVDPSPSAARPQGHVEFDGVSFGYQPDSYVLKNISFSATRGETVALVGHTGSGKSSIMNLLLGFYEPAAGEIRIDGREVRTFSKQALRKHMGIVLQDPYLFTGDIRSNVALHHPELTDEQVWRALQEVGADRFVSRLPRGMQEPVVERGSTLSAGERQLISFARALVYDPAILILDEATASIDSETEALIQRALDVVREGRTTFIIAHRLSTIKEADTILVLHRGEIVERGTHDELMAREGRYYRMYQLQSNEPSGSESA